MHCIHLANKKHWTDLFEIDKNRRRKNKEIRVRTPDTLKRRKKPRNENKALYRIQYQIFLKGGCCTQKQTVLPWYENSKYLRACCFLSLLFRLQMIMITFYHRQANENQVVNWKISNELANYLSGPQSQATSSSHRFL